MDATKEIIEIPAERLYGMAETFRTVDQTIAPGDGMRAISNDERYLTVGASALSAILSALEAAGVEPNSVKRILDYACGYGRVLRWLKARFPQAVIIGVDADRKAAAGASAALRLDVRPLDLALEKPIDEPFDLIWVGSLFTHLPETEVLRVLGYLKSHLTPRGVLVFSTHGELVLERLASRSRTYNLSEEGVAQAVRGYEENDYGFAGYPHSPDYGISVTKPARMNALVAAAGMRGVFFEARRWDAHQDTFACVRATGSAAKEEPAASVAAATSGIVCPICFSNEFIDFNRRPKVRCASCGSFERGRLSWMTLSRLGCLRRGARFLNFAPEPFMLTHGSRVIGDSYEPADFSPELFGVHAPRLKKVDLCRDLGMFPQAAYDVVMHNHVLEHVRCDVVSVIRRLNSLLHPGVGWHVFSVPIFPLRVNDEDYSPELTDEERIKRFAQNDHVRVFGHDFMRIFENAGIADGLIDLGELMTREDLERWGVPTDALDGPSPHRTFAWLRPAA